VLYKHVGNKQLRKSIEEPAIFFFHLLKFVFAVAWVVRAAGQGKDFCMEPKAARAAPTLHATHGFIFP